MKNRLTTLLCAAVTAAVVGFSGNLQAVPISGTASYNGTAVMDTGDFTTGHGFLMFADGAMGAAAALYGDYAGTHDAVVTQTTFTFDPPAAGIVPLFTFVLGATTYSFDLTLLNVDFRSPTAILLSGLGTAHITGKDDTQGLFNFSAQTQGTAGFTYSASITVPPDFRVPDGGSTLMMLGGVLSGVGFLGRRKMA